MAIGARVAPKSRPYAGYHRDPGARTTMGLREWNQRLAENFDKLARDRKDIPLFALEHGLTPAEVLTLSTDIRAHILASPPAHEHALAWVVYAVEIGYGYSGDEYWQTFEEKTPGWTERGDRGWIRNAFVAFQKKYSGAEPSGAWAKHFSIICWPITHAILPRDLQQQLAQVLYQLRHAFSAELFDSPLELGRFIAARSWHTSARFQNLVQEPALVGQIAVALLLQGTAGAKTLLHPMTLKRIGDDVDHERQGREWLRNARQVAQERAKIRGLTLGRPTSQTVDKKEAARSEVMRLGIEPRLVLRPIENARWEVLLEIPDLSQLLLRFPQASRVLAESRCSVAGSAERPLARGRLLHGPQRVSLSRWPRPDEVLLKFEASEPQLDYLLRGECLLRPGPKWLFRVASDGIAYESRGLRVRAGSRYVLVSAEPFNPPAVAQRAEITCKEIHSALLDVPPALTATWEEALRQLNVLQAKTIEVWPAGLSAVTWDGEGQGEWLASETPILAIRSDHAIDELTVSMGDGGQSLAVQLTNTTVGQPVFVELPALPIGLHKVSVAARSGTGASSTVVGDLSVLMRVREARPWAQGASSTGPLDVEIDPAAPSLEQMWEGSVAVVIRGPVGRQATCRLKLFARSNSSPVFERLLPPINLPVAAEDWDDYFEAHLKKRTDAQKAYDEAQSCEIEFEAEELGLFTFRCEREFTPLRWSVRRSARGILARLHDDSGQGAPEIERYSFERPTRGERLARSTEHVVPPEGGLYVARLGNFRTSIVTPPVVHRLDDLRCEPLFDDRDCTPQAIARKLSLAQLWSTARLSGDLAASTRRKTVIRAIARHTIALLAGQEWLRAEERLGGPDGLASLLRSIGRDRASADMARQLQSSSLRLPAMPIGKRAQELASLAVRAGLIAPSPSHGEVVRETTASGLIAVRRVSGIGPSFPPWLAEFALRLASDPASLLIWAGDHLDGGIRKLAQSSTFVRAARFVVLAVDQQTVTLASTKDVYAGWNWSL